VSVFIYFLRMSKDKNKGKLERTLGLGDIIMFGVGGIVGAGIYAIIGEAAGLAGDMLWLSFAIAATVALLTGLAYAEFVSRFPDAGGSFEYVKQAFNQKTALWLSVIMLFTGIVAPAAIAISFADYLGRLWEIPHWIPTVGIIALMGTLNIIGAQESSWFNTFATIVTLLGLGSVVWFSASEWGSADLLKMPENGVTGLLSGAALIFFSYVGFEDLVKIAEETKEPEKVMPKGVLISGLIVLVIYILIAVSVVNVLSPDDLAKSKGPLAQVLSSVAGKTWVTALIIVALFATGKTILSNVLGSSRLLFDIARDSGAEWMTKLAKVDKGRGTPTFAILAICAVVVAFSLIGNLKVVASISNIFVFSLFILINWALIRFRRRNPDAEKPYFKVPLNINRIPVLTVIALTGLVVLLGFNVYNLF
jgi:APA family basic amino acid/polyamine antiporter